MKYLGVSQAPIWTAIGSCSVPTSYNGGMITPPFTCVVNGYFSLLCFCHGRNFGEYRGWILYSFDDNGGVCTYKSNDFIYNSDIESYGQNIVQSGNDFTCTFSDVGSFHFIIPNVFIAGVTYTIYTSKSSPPSPCGGGALLSVTYLARQNLVAYEYSDAHPVSQNYWASLYKNGYFVGGGYIGNYPSNVDPFNQITQTLPPNITTAQVFYKQGSYIYANGSSNGYTFQKYGFTNITLVGDPTSLVCGVGNSNVYMTSDKASYVNASDIGIPNALNNAANMIGKGCSDTPNYWALNAQANIAVKGICAAIVTPDFFINIQQLGGSFNAGFGLVIKKNKIYCLTDISGGFGRSFQAYKADFDFAAAGLAPLPIVQRAQYNGLANYHRAVSPHGLFQA